MVIAPARDATRGVHPGRRHSGKHRRRDQRERLGQGEEASRNDIEHQGAMCWQCVVCRPQKREEALRGAWAGEYIEEMEAKGGKRSTTQGE